MNSFDINLQVEDFEFCDYYNELMEALEEMAKERYKEEESEYSPEKEI